MARNRGGRCLYRRHATAAQARPPTTRGSTSIPGNHKVLLEHARTQWRHGIARGPGCALYRPTGLRRARKRPGRPDCALPQRIRACSTIPLEKYKLGEFFKIDDPETGKPAVRNPYYLKMSEPLLPKWRCKADRPGREGHRLRNGDPFLQRLVAKQMGMKHEDVRADEFRRAVQRSPTRPSGVVGMPGAVARGCTYSSAARFAKSAASCRAPGLSSPAPGTGRSRPAAREAAR